MKQRVVGAMITAHPVSFRESSPPCGVAAGGPLPEGGQSQHHLPSGVTALGLEPDSGESSLRSTCTGSMKRWGESRCVNVIPGPQDLAMVKSLRNLQDK